MSEKVKLRRVKEVEVADKSPEGLKDGGHVYPSCSNCNAILMDIWRTRPHEPEVWKVRANCPFCGDKSFATEVQGGFHFGGFGLIKQDDEDDDIPSTTVESWDIQGDTFVFNIRKANEHAKPVYKR